MGKGSTVRTRAIPAGHFHLNSFCLANLVIREIKPVRYSWSNTYIVIEIDRNPKNLTTAFVVFIIKMGFFNSKSHEIIASVIFFHFPL